MVLITLKLWIARRIISPWKKERNTVTNVYLENKIQLGEWDSVPPIWITPNFILNRVWIELRSYHLLLPALKPFIMYNGHHRFDKAIEYDLPIRAYVRYTPGNPQLPEEERLVEDYGL